MALDVACLCRECDFDHVYRCPRCHRLVPWCFGAADNHSELCDDCWHSIYVSTWRRWLWWVLWRFRRPALRRLTA